MAEEKVDRLSCLSDDVCHHILSFLPNTKHRARTSLLSKSWRHLWAHHPVIRLSLGPCPSSNYIARAKARAYARAVDQCLHAYRATNLEKLDIDLWLPPDPSSSEAQAYADATSRWFNFAASRSVKILCITGQWKEQDRPAKLPVSIFNCRSLQALHLNHCTFQEIPSDFPGFGSLKTLYISRTYISRKELDVLLRTSPALQSLGLDGITLYSSSSTEPLRLCFRNLKEIKLHSDYFQRIDIHAPRLDSIVFIGDLTLLSLNCPRAFTRVFLFDSMHKPFENYSDWMRLISAVSQAERLQVNGWFFQFKLRRNHPNDHLCPMFKNLIQLDCQIDWLTKPALHALASVLRECPSLSDLRVTIVSGVLRYRNQAAQQEDSALHLVYLEILHQILENDQEEDINDPSDPFKDFETPLCQLKAVTIKEFMGTPKEIQLVKFILGKGVSLKTLTIFDFFQSEMPNNLEFILPSVIASPHVELHWNN